MKIYPQVLTSSIKPQIWLFHVVLLTTAKKWTKLKNARAERAKLLFFPTKFNMQICDVLVAVTVVVAKAPYSLIGQPRHVTIIQDGGVLKI